MLSGPPEAIFCLFVRVLEFLVQMWLFHSSLRGAPFPVSLMQQLCLFLGTPGLLGLCFAVHGRCCGATHTAHHGAYLGMSVSVKNPVPSELGETLRPLVGPPRPLTNQRSSL